MGHDGVVMLEAGHGREGGGGKGGILWRSYRPTCLAVIRQLPISLSSSAFLGFAAAARSGVALTI